jgi:Flp pilus assembly protein TadB
MSSSGYERKMKRRRKQAWRKRQKTREIDGCRLEAARKEEKELGGQSDPVYTFYFVAMFSLLLFFVLFLRLLGHYVTR